MKPEQVEGYEHAATVILLAETKQGIEVLLLRRNPKLNFAGGKWVFPGGKIDPSDVDLQQPDNFLLTAKNAAARETMEEAGLSLEVKDLLHFSQWTPPQLNHRKFNTLFFLAPVEADQIQDVRIEYGEIHEHKWITPAQGMLGNANKVLPMMPPTYISLASINQFSNVNEVLEYYKNQKPFHFKPHLVNSFGSDEEIVILYQGDASYETLTEQKEGPKHRAVMKGDVIDYISDFDGELADVEFTLL